MHLTLRDGRHVDFIEEKKIPIALSQSSFCVILAARSKFGQVLHAKFQNTHYDLENTSDNLWSCLLN